MRVFPALAELLGGEPWSPGSRARHTFIGTRRRRSFPLHHSVNDEAISVKLMILIYCLFVRRETMVDGSQSSYGARRVVVGKLYRRRFTLAGRKLNPVLSRARSLSDHSGGGGTGVS